MLNVFLSWSGEASNAVAATLSEWLPVILQGVKPFISDKDLRKGGRWSFDLANELENSNFGIICLTPDNLEAPWILFEAGAISKSVAEGRVAPLLLDVKPSDLPEPLTHFNATQANAVEVKKLVKSINEASNTGLSEHVLYRSFDQSWPEIEKGFAVARSLLSTGATAKQVSYSPEEIGRILEEVLATTRRLSGQLDRFDGPNLAAAFAPGGGIANLARGLDNPGILASGVLGDLGEYAGKGMKLDLDALGRFGGQQAKLADVLRAALEQRARDQNAGTGRRDPESDEET